MPLLGKAAWQQERPPAILAVGVGAHVGKDVRILLGCIAEYHKQLIAIVFRLQILKDNVARDGPTA